MEEQSDFPSPLPRGTDTHPHTHTYNREFPRERESHAKVTCSVGCLHVHTAIHIPHPPCIPINLLSSFYTLYGPQRNQACTCMKMTSHLGYNNQYSSSSSSNRVVAKQQNQLPSSVTHSLYFILCDCRQRVPPRMKSVIRSRRRTYYHQTQVPDCLQ